MFICALMRHVFSIPRKPGQFLERAMKDFFLKSLAAHAAKSLRGNPGWLDEVVDTEEAARIVNESPATLCSKRTRGGGPVFVKSGSLVGYARRDLFEYIAARRRTSTSDKAA
jgi:hypothetical protein